MITQGRWYVLGIEQSGKPVWRKSLRLNFQGITRNKWKLELEQELYKTHASKKVRRGTNKWEKSI